MRLVTKKEQVISNIRTFDSYASSADYREKQFYEELFPMGKQYACIRESGRILFCPSRFAGYVKNTIDNHKSFKEKHGGDTTKKLRSVLGNYQENNICEKAFLQRCSELSLKPSKNERDYWLINGGTDVASARRHASQVARSDGSIVPPRYMEGGAESILTNKYERNPKARSACIGHFGYDCRICGFNFEARYGELGRKFIQVHHLYPKKLRSRRYMVNPKTDLIPVCSNCHSMLHRKDPPHVQEHLKKKLGHQ